MSSNVTPNLELTLLDGRFKLNSKRAIYSFEDKYKSFAQAFQKIKVPKSSSHSILILGYGLGSISNLLVTKYKSTSAIKGVELDTAIVQLNQEYGFKSPHISIVQKSAEDYIHTSTQKYDLICHDVFVDTKVPSQCLQNNYLHSLSTLLVPKGQLLFSLMGTNNVNKQLNYEFFELNVKQMFPEAELWDLGYNQMVYAKNK